jgi:hypothetical protein
MDEACLVHHKSVAGKVPFCTHSVISCSVFFRRKKLHIIFTWSECFKNTHTHTRTHTTTHTHTHVHLPLFRHVPTCWLHVSVRLVIILRTPIPQTRHRSSPMNTDTFHWCVKETDSVSERIIQLHTEIGRNTVYRHSSTF